MQVGYKLFLHIKLLSILISTEAAGLDLHLVRFLLKYTSNDFYFFTTLEFAQPTGLPLNSTYPYISANGTCVAMTAVLPKPIYTRSIQYSLAGNEVYLKNILAQDGPVVVSIYMTNLFQLYKSGIFQDTIPAGGCSIHNHSVLLVGKIRNF